MAPPEILERLQAEGFTVTFRPPDRIDVAPKGALTDELRQLIREHKPGLLEALRPMPRRRASKRPGEVCGVCKGEEFWERGPTAGGGRLCCRCHPDPADLLAQWERRTRVGMEPVELSPRREVLFRWALSRGCPELRFRPWTAVAGSPQEWQTFLLRASDDDVEAAWVAAESWRS